MAFLLHLAFLAKKTLGLLLMPLPIAALLFLLAWLRRRHRDARVYAASAVLLLIVPALPLMQQWLGAPLEADLHPYRGAATAHIVVLSGAYDAMPPRVLWDEMNVSTLRRTLEGVRLAKQHPRATLWMSGGNPFGGAPAADSMAALAQQLGIAPGRIRIERDSLDTESQAGILATSLGRQPFLLVTSAFHQPRAVALFRAAGTQPIAAPTDFITRAPYRFHWRDLVPSGSALRDSEQALHEYYGLLWAWLRGAL